MSVAPTVRAIIAVAARRGLRTELSTASMLGTPTRRSGTPTRRTMPRTSSGPRTTTPTKATRAAPVTMNRPVGSGPVMRVRPIRPAEIANSSRPNTTRTQPVPFSRPEAVALVRRAASGATRVARMAGTRAENTVIRVPSSRPLSTAPGPITTEAVTSVPMSGPAKRAPAIPMPIPASTPRIEETIPTTKDSVSTERKTWPRLAPTQRSRASSRWRCAMRIAKVL